MRTPTPFFALLLFAASVGVAPAQQTVRHVDLEVEPLAYAFGGAGGHIGLQVGDWKYEIEAFGLEIPASLHGNNGFTASPRGVELHAEHLFGDGPGGFYAGPEAGLVRLDLTHDASGTSERHTRYDDSTPVRSSKARLYCPWPGRAGLSPLPPTREGIRPPNLI